MLRPMRYLSARSPLIERAMSGKHNDVKIESDPLSVPAQPLVRTLNGSPGGPRQNTPHRSE
jgi:hypothetical protein